jgi:hypothetical protein
MHERQGNMKILYTVVERGGKSYWTKIGTGTVNRDGSITMQLDCMPLSGNIQVRDAEPVKAAK